MEIWEPKPPGTLWATPGLLRESFTFLHFFTCGLITPAGMSDIKFNLCPIENLQEKKALLKVFEQLTREPNIVVWSISLCEKLLVLQPLSISEQKLLHRVVTVHHCSPDPRSHVTLCNVLFLVTSSRYPFAQPPSTMFV